MRRSGSSGPSAPTRRRRSSPGSRTGRYVKVNEGFLELTGYVREALIGPSMHEIDVLGGAEKRDLAVERLHAGRTIPQMEACLGTAKR